MKFYEELQVWPRDQLITFWWRSASLSGSESPFRITIRTSDLIFVLTLVRYQIFYITLRSGSGKNWRSAEVYALWVLLVRLLKTSDGSNLHTTQYNTVMKKKTMPWGGNFPPLRFCLVPRFPPTAGCLLSPPIVMTTQTMK